MSPTDRTLAARLRTWRHHLHRHSETAFAEHETADHVASILQELE